MIELNAMHIPKLLLILLVILLMTSPVTAQSPSEKPVVISPRAGEAVQGRIEINGITDIIGLQRVEIEYRYTNDPKDTWFLVAETDQPVNPGKIAEWDSSVVTDGNYDLRVTILLQDGSSQSISVAGIRVRNYSPIETPTPPQAGTAPENVRASATILPTRTPRPTKPSFSANPAELTKSDLNSSLMRGGIAGLGFFLAFAIYWIIKKSLS